MDTMLESNVLENEISVLEKRTEELIQTYSNLLVDYSNLKYDFINLVKEQEMQNHKLSEAKEKIEKLISKLKNIEVIHEQ
jgi:hemoglobin-like flavoprotein